MEICSICMEPLREDVENPDLQVYQTKCNHKFHKGCILNYCTIRNGKNLQFSGIPCPLCKTPLNCNLGGVDIFPEKKEIPVQKKTLVDKALDIIPEEEYDIINSPEDIVLPESFFGTENKEQTLQQIFDEITKRKGQQGGKRRRKSKTKRKRQKKRKTRQKS